MGWGFWRWRAGDVGTSATCAAGPPPRQSTPPPPPTPKTPSYPPQSLYTVELAPEAAATYYRYGEALLRSAQASTDVLGARVRAAADERAAAQAGAEGAEGGEGDGAAAGAHAAAADGDGPPPEADPEPARGKENRGKGNARVSGEEGGEGEEGGGESSSDDDDAADSDADAADGEGGDDTDLAWQMLDIARSILQKEAGRELELAGELCIWVFWGGFAGCRA